MEKDSKLIDLRCSLTQVFLIQAQKEIVDVSFSLSNNKITIQIVLLEGAELAQFIMDKINKNLKNYEVEINKVSISREKFNQNLGDWLPTFYNWLPHLVLSKAEVI